MNGSINNGKDISMLLVNPVITTNHRLRKNNLHVAENYVTDKIEIHEIKQSILSTLSCLVTGGTSDQRVILHEKMSRKERITFFHLRLRFLENQF